MKTDKLECVNLEELFGDKYEITRDPAYRKNNPDPWTFLMKCKFGEIYPYGDNLLAVQIDYHNGIANNVSRLPGAAFTQCGDFEKTLAVPVEEFKELFKIMKPKRKRKITKEHKEKLDRGRAHLCPKTPSNDAYLVDTACLDENATSNPC
jgi:hypothetical protein